MIVVTVCTANLCRSPFAARVLQRAFDFGGVDVTVVSTGVDVREGSMPPRGWIDVAAEFGIDLRSHRSVDPHGVLAAADLVLTMTADHSRAVAMGWPELIGRVTTLGEAARRVGSAPLATDPVAALVGARRGRDVLLASNQDDIADPVRRFRRFKRSVATQIVVLSEHLAASWPSGPVGEPGDVGETGKRE